MRCEGSNLRNPSSYRYVGISVLHPSHIHVCINHRTARRNSYPHPSSSLTMYLGKMRQAPDKYFFNDIAKKLVTTRQIKKRISLKETLQLHQYIPKLSILLCMDFTAMNQALRSCKAYIRLLHRHHYLLFKEKQYHYFTITSNVMWVSLKFQ